MDNHTADHRKLEQNTARQIIWTSTHSFQGWTCSQCDWNYPIPTFLNDPDARTAYDRLAAAGRLTRPKHWLEFKPFAMSFTPLGITADQAQAEVRQAWASSYSPQTIASAMGWLGWKSFPDRLIHLLCRLAFRGIYFPQMKRRDWVQVLFQNRGPILRLLAQALELKFKPQPREPFSLDPELKVERTA